MGCLEEQMPQECRDFVNNVHVFIVVSSELFFGIPFHKLWRTKKWKKLVESLGAIFMYTKGHVDQKIMEIEEARSKGDAEHQAELGMDFLTYMIYSGNLSVKDIAMNSIDLLTAAVDTVRGFHRNYHTPPLHHYMQPY